MKIDNNDKELIGLLYRQYRQTTDETIKKGYRYVLKDMLGRFLLQVKHYEPWASEAAIEKAREKSINLSDVFLHDCYIPGKERAAFDKKLFVDGNRPTEFHLEHDPPTLHVVNTILDGDGTPESITSVLDKYRLCFVTGEEDKTLTDNGYRTKVPPDGDRYTHCKIEARKLP